MKHIPHPTGSRRVAPVLPLPLLLLLLLVPVPMACSSTDTSPQYYTIAQRAAIRVGMREKDVIQIMGEPTFTEGRGASSHVVVYEGDEDAQFGESFDLYHFNVVIEDGKVATVYKENEPTPRR